ncbi:MAG TPA: phosphotransferase, partial [Ardenticatenaceae bacterium]|nr:phosphotransferase [Ardenticatenaceae bacterium]
LEACIAKYLFMGPLSQEERAVRDLFLSQGIISSVELEKIATQLDAAKNWGTQSVLVHYDNRLANLIVDGGEVTLVDWGLAYAGIGLPQELIKVTEAPPASPEHAPLSAFLQGYGLAEEEWTQASERGTLMLVLDGLAMSYSWAGNPAYLGGIRGWLQSIKRICRRW